MLTPILGAWWDRLRGRLRPRPCPYTLAGALDMPGRRLVAGSAKILSAFGIGAGDTVLEIGSGTGFYSVDAARRVGPSGRLLCLDLQARMLQRARRRLADAGLAADLVQANARVRTCSSSPSLARSRTGEPPWLRSSGSFVPKARLSISEQFPDPDFGTLRQLRRDLAKSAFVELRSKGLLWYTSTWSKAPTRF